MINLTEAEQRLAKFLARSRFENARAKGITNSKIGDQSNEETDLEGIGSEIAFCKMSNIYPDLQTDFLPVEDAVLRTGETIDVKSTKYENGHLLVAKWKQPDVQLYALMVGKFPSYRCAGFFPSKSMISPSRLKNFGHGEGYAAKQHELDPLDSPSLQG